MYLWIAVLHGVPSDWNSAKILSLSTIWRTISTVLDGT